MASPEQRHFEIDPSAGPDLPSWWAARGARLAQAAPGHGSGSAAEPAGPSPLIALPVRRDLPPHPRLPELFGLTIPGVTMPLGRVAAHGGDWVICRAPAGLPLDRVAGSSMPMSGGSAGPTPLLAPPTGSIPAAGGVPTGNAAGGASRIPEQTLIQRVLRPAAETLGRLARRGLTHRAIRPDNVFLGPDGLELGPFWLSPPAHDQPATLETPLVAATVRTARGTGTIADDVYALGAMLLGLSLGAPPLQGRSDDDIVERKLWNGSVAALLDGRRMSPALGEIVAAMVVDDPSRRPTAASLERPSMITPPATVRLVTASMPLGIAGREIWTAPQLAWMLGFAPTASAEALRSGRIDDWLRRALRDASLADRIEQLTLQALRLARPDRGGDEDATDRLLLSHAATLLDPAGPLTWGPFRFDPSAIGGLVRAIAGPELAEAFPPAPASAEPDHGTVVSMLSGEALAFHAEHATADAAGRRRLQDQARRHGTAARTTLGRLRLVHAANPSLACLSPRLGALAAVSLDTLIDGLERDAAGAAPAIAGDAVRLLDDAALAFILERDAPRSGLVRAGPGYELRLLAPIAREMGRRNLPAIAARLATPLVSELDRWPGRTRRAARRAEIERIVKIGSLPHLLELALDRDAIRRDEDDREAAAARIEALRAERALLGDRTLERREAANRFGRDGTTVLAIAGAAGALLSCTLS